MAESNSARLGLRLWSADSDGPSRAEFNDGHATLDLLTAIDKQDTFPNRPAPAIRGTYFYDTTNAILWRDTGSAWTVVGAVTRDAIANASAVGSVPLTAVGIAGQTANLFEAKVVSTVKASISKDGNIVGAVHTGTSGSFINDTAGNIVLLAKGAASQSGDLIQARTSADVNRFKVTAAGAIVGTSLSAQSGAAVLGKDGYSNVANMNLFNGTPALEAYAASGGGGAFTDFMYLHHQAADGTAVTRRLGLLMKIGDETVGDAGKSGAIYIESAAASAASPTLVLARGDAPVMTFPPTGFGALTGNMTIVGQLSLSPGSNPSLLLGNARAGVQGNHLYLRAGSTAGFYFYKDGSHSDTPGDAGGGSMLAQLDSNGRFVVGKESITATTTATLAEGSPAFMIGSGGAANLIGDTGAIQARNNGVAATLTLNPGGGSVVHGSNVDWTDLTAAANWTATVFKYSRHNGHLFLNIVITRTGSSLPAGSSTDSLLGTLPTGFRPTLAQRVLGYIAGAFLAVATIEPTGEIILTDYFQHGVANGEGIFFSTVSFPV